MEKLTNFYPLFKKLHNLTDTTKHRREDNWIDWWDSSLEQQLVWPDNDLFTCSQQSLMKLFALWAKNGNEDLDAHSEKPKLYIL